MKRTFLLLGRSLSGALLVWLGGATVAAAAPYQEEQRVDRELGLLNHPWKINLVSLHTSDYLRLRSQVKTGLQSFDQQVERANESPAALMDILKPPVVSPASKGKEEPTTAPPGWKPPPEIHIIVENQ